jgi:hypothetical protein
MSEGSGVFSYSNLVITGCSRREIVCTLEGLGRDAYISPEIDGKTVVYDRQCDDELGYQPLRELALTLTGVLRCGALAFVNALDQYLLCMLFLRGGFLARISHQGIGCQAAFLL